MTKEALKLAMEALHGFIPYLPLNDEAQCGRYDKAITAIKEALAQQALDRKAENARELGLDYEPERLAELGWQEIDCPICGGGARAFPKPEQEPVAWMHTKIEGVAVPHRPADLDKHPDRWTPLYKDPKPCPTCEALARTVMLDQTSHDTTPPQRTWVGLTDEEKQEWIDAMPYDPEPRHCMILVNVIEAKLKEKNT